MLSVEKKKRDGAGVKVGVSGGKEKVKEIRIVVLCVGGEQTEASIVIGGSR